MAQEIFVKIFSKHKKQLKNLNVKNKPLLICFSAIPGAGKTHIAKILEKRYKAVRITNDDIRKTFKKLFPKIYLEEEKREKIIKNYLIWLLKSNSFQNRLIILDSGIERKYDFIKENTDKKFKIFIIQINVKRNIAEKRAKVRNNNKIDKHFENNIDRWIKENKAFAKRGKIDVIISNNTSKLNIKKVYFKLDKKLK